MDALMVLLIIIAGLVLLGTAALAVGVDSRDGVGDDHRRALDGA